MLPGLQVAPDAQRPYGPREFIQASTASCAHALSHSVRPNSFVTPRAVAR